MILKNTIELSLRRDISIKEANDSIIARLHEFSEQDRKRKEHRNRSMHLKKKKGRS